MVVFCGLGAVECRGAGHRHEAQVCRQVIAIAEDAVGAGDQGIVGLQRNIDRAVAALGDEIEAVIEELPEQCHPAAVRRRQADIGRLVGDDGKVGVGDLDVHAGIDDRAGGDRVLAGMRGQPGVDRDRICEPGLDRRGIVNRLIDDEVRDRAGIGVGDVAGKGVVVVGDDRRAWAERHCVAIGGIGGRFEVAEVGGQQAWEELVRGTRAVLPGQQVVIAAVDRAQALRQQGIVLADDVDELFAGGVPLRNLDLIQDLGKIC